MRRTAGTNDDPPVREHHVDIARMNAGLIQKKIHFLFDSSQFFGNPTLKLGARYERIELYIAVFETEAFVFHMR